MTQLSTRSKIQSERHHSYRGKKRFRNNCLQEQPFQHLHRSSAAAKPFKRPRGNDGSSSSSGDENTSPSSSQVELQDSYTKQKLLGGCRPSSMKSIVNRSAYFADATISNKCDQSSATPPKKSEQNDTVACDSAAYPSRSKKTDPIHEFSSPFVGKSFVPLSRTSSSFTPSHLPVDQPAVASSQPYVKSSTDKCKNFSGNERSLFGMFRRKREYLEPSYLTRFIVTMYDQLTKLCLIRQKGFGRIQRMVDLQAIGRTKIVEIRA